MIEGLYAVCSLHRGEALIKKRISDAINGAIKGLIMFDIATNSDIKKLFTFPPKPIEKYLL